MASYFSANLLDFIEQIGEDAVNNILSDFSCPPNEEIESYLKKNSVRHSKSKTSITYLVFDEEFYLVGYYTLTHKMTAVPNDKLNKREKKRMDSYIKKESEEDDYHVSAFLIAQFGKNYRIPKEQQIDGSILLDMTINTVKRIQREIGGTLVFLECEEKDEFLERFYSDGNNCFHSYGTRISKNGIKYRQMLRVL